MWPWEFTWPFSGGLENYITVVDIASTQVCLVMHCWWQWMGYMSHTVWTHSKTVYVGYHVMSYHTIWPALKQPVWVKVEVCQVTEHSMSPTTTLCVGYGGGISCHTIQCVLTLNQCVWTKVEICQVTEHSMSPHCNQCVGAMVEVWQAMSSIAAHCEAICVV